MLDCNALIELPPSTQKIEGDTHQCTETAPSAPDREYIAAWHEVSMDATAWWKNESITPIHAALILAGHNPNTGIEADVILAAETTMADGFGPREFRTLKHKFESASKDEPRTLENWLAYAQRHEQNVHPWVSEWLLAHGAALALQPVSPVVIPSADAKVILPKIANNWDEHGLHRLYCESIQPGMTHQKLAERYGVTRQRIGALLKEAKPKKASPFAALGR